MERLEGHFEQARKLFAESLGLKVIVMDRAGILYSLEAFAQLAADQNQFRRAVMLWAAADHLRQSSNLAARSVREDLYGSPIPTARTQLGEESFHAAWADGWAMKMQQAIDYALTLPGD